MAHITSVHSFLTKANYMVVPKPKRPVKCMPTMVKCKPIAVKCKPTSIPEGNVCVISVDVHSFYRTTILSRGVELPYHYMQKWN